MFKNYELCFLIKEFDNANLLQYNKKSLASTQFINNNDVSLFKMLVEKIKYKVI